MILLIEDNEMMRGLVELILTESGYKVLPAADGVEAVDAYRKFGNDIELVISDLEMPRLNGLDAFRQMKEINPNIKTIFASGYLDTAIKNQLQHEGARYFIHKPYSQDEILDAIRLALK